MNIWCMHNPETVLEDETHKILWDFKIQTDHLISARQLDVVIVNKKQRTCRTVDFAVLVEYRVKFKEGENRYSYRNASWELQKTMELDSDGDTSSNQCAHYSHRKIRRELENIRNKSTSGHHPNDSIVKNG